MENHSSNDQQNPPKLGSCCCPPSSNNSQAIVPVAAVEEKNQLISKIIRILMRAVGIFVARKVILWAIGFGPYGVISNTLATKLVAYAEHTKTSWKGLVALLKSGGSGFTPSKGYIAFVAGQIIFVVAPEIKSRLLKSQQVLAQHDPNLAKIQIVANDSSDNNTANNDASLRPKLEHTAAEENNNPKQSVISRELRQSTGHLIDAGLIIGSQIIGLPPIFIPLIKPGREFVTNLVQDPYVQEKAGQIGSAAKGAYFWTKNTAHSATNKTGQVIYTSYTFAKDKTRQGISTTVGLIPEWNYVSMAPIGLPNLAKLYRRSAPTTPPQGDQKLTIRC